MANLAQLAGVRIQGHVSRGSHTCDPEQRKADIYNSLAGNLPGPDCPKCRNKGYVMRIEDGYKVVEECECMPVRRSIARMERSGLGPLLEQCTFERYQTPCTWQEAAKKMALDYSQDPAGRWFVASGVSGSGKTHLCTAICGELLRSGVECRYMLWVDESRKLKAVVNDDEPFQQLIKPLEVVKVLYIDDLFKPRTEEDRYTRKRRRVTATASDITIAYEILNSRVMRPDLLTIISTELSVDEIMDLDSALGSRIYQKSKGSYLLMTGDKNWRLRA